MKTSLIFLLCFSWLGSLACGEDPAYPRQSAEIVYLATAKAFYAAPEEVIYEYVIENHSKVAMVVPSHGLDRIKLYGPDGKLVRPYPYRPSGAGSISYYIYTCGPGERCERTMCLSALFPFPVAGEYRCQLTQRVYLWHSPDEPSVDELDDNDFYGTPVEVTANEIRFRVEKATSPDRDSPKVDPSNAFFEPGFEYDPMKSEKYYLRGEGHYKRKFVAISTQSSIIMLLIVSAVGLLWMLLKQRS